MDLFEIMTIYISPPKLVFCRYGYQILLVTKTIDNYWQQHFFQHFLQNADQRHTKVLQWGQSMDFPLWLHSFFYILLLSLSHQ